MPFLYNKQYTSYKTNISKTLYIYVIILIINVLYNIKSI